MRLWNKKGITPLIASILLISFAVAIGVVVMNFGRAQVEEDAECAINIGLKFSMISGVEDVCHDGSALRFTIENGVNIAVSGLVVNIIGTEKAETTQLNDAQMDKAGSYVGRVLYNKGISGKIRQLKITPKVILFDEEQICTEKALVTETVRDC